VLSAHIYIDIFSLIKSEVRDIFPFDKVRHIFPVNKVRDIFSLIKSDIFFSLIEKRLECNQEKSEDEL
jgi:hypothetical protein